MKQFRFIFVFVVFHYVDFAQNGLHSSNHVNELKYKYFNSPSDTAKLNALTNLITEYYGVSDFKNTLLYNRQLKLISKLKTSADTAYQLLGKTSEADYYNNLGNVFQKQSNYNQANANFFQALNLHLAVNNKSDAGIVLSNISATFSELGNYK